MKAMIFMCLSLVVMAGIARVYMAGGLDGILGTGSDDFRLKAPKNVKAVTTDKDVEVYKWRDERGVMHFGEAPPDLSGKAEKITLKANQNVVDAMVVKKEEDRAVSEVQHVDMGNPYSPQGMVQMLDQTKALTESLNKQQAEKQKMMEGMRQR